MLGLAWSILLVPVTLILYLMFGYVGAILGTILIFAVALSAIGPYLPKTVGQWIGTTILGIVLYWIFW
jgi:hypothetical protein